jgi:hypothetical protein
MTKNITFLNYFHLLTESESRCEPRSLYGTFVELNKFRFLTHTFQGPRYVAAQEMKQMYGVMFITM